MCLYYLYRLVYSEYLKHYNLKKPNINCIVWFPKVISLLTYFRCLEIYFLVVQDTSWHWYLLKDSSPDSPSHNDVTLDTFVYLFNYGIFYWEPHCKTVIWWWCDGVFSTSNPNNLWVFHVFLIWMALITGVSFRYYGTKFDPTSIF